MDLEYKSSRSAHWRSRLNERRTRSMPARLISTRRESSEEIDDMDGQLPPIALLSEKAGVAVFDCFWNATGAKLTTGVPIACPSMNTMPKPLALPERERCREHIAIWRVVLKSGQWPSLASPRKKNCAAS